MSEGAIWAVTALLASMAPLQTAVAGEQCRMPASFPVPRPIPPPPGQARPRLPIGGYVLAISWSPAYCARNGGGARLQCSGEMGRFGFILHGLWPQGRGREWPQYCRQVSSVPRQVIAETLCATPSPQLMQHEWAKHGSCMAADAGSYFAKARMLYASVGKPDMRALSARRELTAGNIADAFAAANPGTTRAMYRVRGDRDGTFEEVLLCLDRALSPAACPTHVRGVRPGARLRVDSR